MTWDNQEKSGVTGAGWFYDEPNLFYDELKDPDSGNEDVFYDGIGLTTEWTNVTES